MLKVKTRLGLMTALLLVSVCSYSQSMRRDLSEADLNWNWPKEDAQRVAYCVGIFDLAAKSAENPAGGIAVKKNGDAAFNRVIKSKKLTEQQLNSYAERGFKRGQVIISKIMGEFDAINEQMKDMQAKEFMKQAVRDCTQMTQNFKP